MKNLIKFIMNDKAAKITAIILLSLTTIVTTLCLINPIYLLYLLLFVIGAFGILMLCSLTYMAVYEILDDDEY